MFMMVSAVDIPELKILAAANARNAILVAVDMTQRGLRVVLVSKCVAGYRKQHRNVEARSGLSVRTSSCSPPMMLCQAPGEVHRSVEQTTGGPFGDRTHLDGDAAASGGSIRPEILMVLPMKQHLWELV